VCLPRRLAGLRRIGSLCSLLLLLVLALPVTSNLLMGELERGIRLGSAVLPLSAASASTTPAAPPQAIVILGGDNATGLGDGGISTGVRIGALSLERVRAGALLQHTTGLPVLVTGGVLSPDHPPVAVLMANMLQNELATQVRWTETLAGDTWQNAANSAAILQHNGITSVYLVTHPWHMRRAIIAFRHFGITVWPAPTAVDVLKPQTAYDFIPDAVSWRDSYFAFHEWVGCAYYALRG
jgi:uncharacterized SAM-binding protein YcdF (DUF218 family)